MTAAHAKHTLRERAIAKALGLTDAGLAGLLRVNAGYSGGTAGELLERQGYVTEQGYIDTAPMKEQAALLDDAGRHASADNLRDVATRAWRSRQLTLAGEDILRRARAMGY
jgi:hypothetical protein